MTSMTEIAVAFLVDGTGRVLLGLRAPHKAAWPHCWDAIGGRLEKGEKVEEALVREIGEELGVTPTKFELMGCLESPSPVGDGVLRRNIFAITEWTGGEPKNASDEHSELRWFALGDVSCLPNVTFEAFAAMARSSVMLNSPDG